jgi:hypothetical protein
MNYPDACPVCHPGIPDVAPPLSAEPTNGGTLTSHQCGMCEARWLTWWTADGWPVARKLLPVTADQAGINRGVLELALAEQDRERGHAA